MAKVRTVKIADKRLKSGFRIINEVDFNPKNDKKIVTKSNRKSNASDKIV